MKQSKLRKRRVVRYSILFFSMLVLFVALAAGPAIIRNWLSFTIDIYQLNQPDDWDNNNTNYEPTGRALEGDNADADAGDADADANARRWAMATFRAY